MNTQWYGQPPNPNKYNLQNKDSIPPKPKNSFKQTIANSQFSQKQVYGFKNNFPKNQDNSKKDFSKKSDFTFKSTFLQGFFWGF